MGTRNRVVWHVLAMTALLMCLVVGAPSGVSAQGNGDAAHACQKGGYLRLAGNDGTQFASTGECVSYGAHGGVVVPKMLQLVFATTDTAGICSVGVTVLYFTPNAEIPVQVDLPDGTSVNLTLSTDSIGWAQLLVASEVAFGDIRATAGDFTITDTVFCYGQ